MPGVQSRRTAGALGRRSALGYYPIPLAVSNQLDVPLLIGAVGRDTVQLLQSELIGMTEAVVDSN